MNEGILYDQQHIDFLEEIWGDGFLSPGGSDEVARVLNGVQIEGKNILDIGCGTGACAALLATEYGAAHVTAIDVEDPVCEAAMKRFDNKGLSHKVSVIKVQPGPFPFDKESFDVVFSKDSIIHVPDKFGLAREAYRVLRTGGQFAVSDWLISHDENPSAQMADYIKAEGLDFAMASPVTYGAALREAGFSHVELVNRNTWYAEVAVEELKWLMGTKRAGLSARHGKDFIDEQIDIWSKLVKVLHLGEHCPHHIRAQKLN